MMEPFQHREEGHWLKTLLKPNIYHLQAVLMNFLNMIHPRRIGRMDEACRSLVKAGKIPCRYPMKKDHTIALYA